MKIELSKDLTGFAYDRVTVLHLAGFDVDLLLPYLYHRVVSRGQNIGHRPNDPTAIAEYSLKMANHENVIGFGEGENSLRLADRLIRTALIQTGRVGLKRNSEQILGILGFSLLSFKPGFPFNSSWLRRVDEMIYQMLCDSTSEEAVLGLFRSVFGRGLELHTGAVPNGSYDGVTELDALTCLQLAYLDGFEPAGIRRAPARPMRGPMPAVDAAMACDLRRYLVAYHSLMPAAALTYHFKALINFELFVATMKLFVAVADLVNDPVRLPSAMRDELAPSPPQLYLDFVQEQTGPNREMSAACVRRDLEAIQRFIPANLTLRHLDRIIGQLRSNRQAVEAAFAEISDGPGYLQKLLQLAADPDSNIWMRIDAAAQRDEERIREKNTDSAADVEDKSRSIGDDLDRIAEPGRSDLERLVLLLTEAQRATIADNVLQWYRSVGGLLKPHGILAGHANSRASWRYAPSNDLLATLVQLAAVDLPEWDKADQRPRAITLPAFLRWLERRFGVLVDRPPAGFGGAEYIAAAQENLRAMLRRLRQMGVFRDLSDDFTVQRLLPPYAIEADEAGETVQV